MAIFGVGDSGSNHAGEAVAAGRESLSAVRQLNDDLAAKGRAPIQIGIGIHTGPAIVGSIGSPQRLEFTAIGSTVNLASRVEALTKTVGETVLLTEATRAAMREAVELREQAPQKVKGVAEPVRVWAL